MATSLDRNPSPYRWLVCAYPPTHPPIPQSAQVAETAELEAVRTELASTVRKAMAAVAAKEAAEARAAAAEAARQEAEAARNEADRQRREAEVGERGTIAITAFAQRAGSVQFASAY